MRFKQFKLEDVDQGPMIWLKADGLIYSVDVQMHANKYVSKFNHLKRNCKKE